MDSRFIDDFDVILLDMGNTFMFGCDRFGPDEDYHATYRGLGGQFLSPDKVRACIAGVFNRMLSACRDPARYDDFGDVRRFLSEPGDSPPLPPAEADLIVEAFSRHEVGRVPDRHAATLRRLRSSHPLGIVSNVWSPSQVFEAELDRAGLLDLFAVRVWSSDSLSIKPSPRLFRKALEAFGVDAARALYVGDDPKRDIAGAKGVGMAAAWIENRARPLTPETPKPDLIIPDLTQLLSVTRRERAAEQPDCARLRPGRNRPYRSGSS